MRRLCVRRWQYALCCWSFLVCALTVPAVVQEIVLKAWAIGPDDPSVYRATNLQIAAERLNAELAQAGALERVKVDTDFWTGQAQQYGQRVLLAFQPGDSPDIVLNGHEFIGRYATAGFIRPLDDLLAMHQAALADIYPVLWQTDWPQYEAIITEAIRAVQARRLAPLEATRFVTMRLRQQLRNQVRIVE
jgi:ABC-type glycerol-3-phosphate transport system substrate-binding protein